MVWSRGGAECASDALQDRWSLGELHSAQIPRKSATRSVGEEEEEEGGREGGEQDYYCSQNKPASDYEPKSSGKMSATRPRRGPSVQETGEPRQETVVWVAFPSPVASDQGFLALSLSLPLSLSRSLSLLFRSVNVRSRSLVSGNDLTQQTESCGRAEQSRGERRGEERGEEERHRLHLAALTLSASPSFATFP